jgi:soluble lytic murein transglycosylase-like protein
MTPFQQQCATIIEQLRKSTEFSAFGFEVFEVMSYIQIESSFNPKATRFEPRLNQSSYGLMQPLLSTARSCGYSGAPEGLYDPRTNITVGMRYLMKTWDTLSAHFRRDPTNDEWVMAYNEGPGNVIKGRTVQNYVDKWEAAAETWQEVFPFSGPENE